MGEGDQRDISEPHMDHDTKTPPVRGLSYRILERASAEDMPATRTVSEDSIIVSDTVSNTPGMWQISIDNFSSKKHGQQAEDKKLSKKARRYYKTQDELIETFEELRLLEEHENDTEDIEADGLTKLRKKASILAKVTFFCNLFLLVAKSVAAGLSSSLSVISAVIDSAMDLVSGALMWWSGRAIKHRNPYQYPQGRTKLEPLAVVVLSVIMALVSVLLISESIQRIITYATDENSKGPTFDIATIVILCVTIGMKVVLYLLCRRVQTPMIQALAQDQRNDVFSNTVALVCGYIGSEFWVFLDPIGAMLISFYIIVSWFITGWEQIKMLTGVTAKPDFLKKITWLALDHHPKVLFIDTVRAFHFGSNFLVECDIVLPADIALRESHDIGETLQAKIERLPDVERAFVHLDYETEHSPASEHKVV